MLQSGLGARPRIDVGDVVYDLNGQMIRLFNCLRPRDQQDEDCRFPEGFEVLEASPCHSGALEQGGITIIENILHPGPAFSSGVEMLDLEAGISAP